MVFTKQQKKIGRVRPPKLCIARVVSCKERRTDQVKDMMAIEHKSSIVLKIISILSKQVEPKYCRRSRDYWAIKIHKKPGSKYFDLFCQIHEYLLELKGKYGNPIEGLIFDYLNCIYSYYDEYKRAPNLNQLRPYESNQVRFIEWIHEWENDMNENYWVVKKSGTFGDISKKVGKILNGKRNVIVNDGVNIIETGH